MLFAVAGILNKNNPKPNISLTKQETALNINQDILLFLSIGNKRLLSDLLWVQTLLESDEVHYSKKDLDSWMYHRFMSISVLDPQFYENYLYGGLYLSIVKDDVIGASEIFEKGLRYFPSDYKLNYYTGFNYYFEQGKYADGLKYLQKIQNHPDAPPFIKLIVGKLHYETTGSPEIALAFLQHELQTSKEPAIIQKLKKEILALQIELDLECLNGQKKNCKTNDPTGKPYFHNGKEWKSATPFELFRIKRSSRLK